MRFQYYQLLGLAGVHLAIDVSAGLAPAMLPVLREQFHLSLTAGVALIVSLNFVSSGGQLVTGRLRSRDERPTFLSLGLLFSGAVCLVGLVPRTAPGVHCLFVLMILSGIGIAICHPEALRAVHGLKHVRPALGTSLFLIGGYCGYSGGTWLGSFLVSRWGLHGLLFVLLLPAAAGVAVCALRIRLAVDGSTDRNEAALSPDQHISLWPLVALGIPVATGALVIPSLLPTCLHDLGFELTFCGFSAFLYGAGAAAGSLFWGSVVRQQRYLHCVVGTLVVGAILLYGYLQCLEHRLAVWLLLIAAFWVGAAYPLIVTLARYARGPGLGARMAWIVGGTWGAANLILLALGPVGERLGVHAVLTIGCCFNLVAAVFGLVLIWRQRRSRQPQEGRVRSV